jgi:hypothetical protein
MDLGNPLVEPWGRTCYYEDQTALTFLAPAVEISTPEGRANLVAHELTHCYRKGTGEWTPNEPVEEEATRRQAHDWGIPDPPGRNLDTMMAIMVWRSLNADQFSRFTETSNFSPPITSNAD